MSFEIFTIGLIIGIFFSIEVLIYTIIKSANKNFQWLIMQKDEKPELSKSGLEKFFVHGYDPELGWVRKPNTFHNEVSKNGNTKWTINSKGARNNPGFENLNSKISCYGDSFTFCRNVNDNETWEHYLSKLKETNVINFGVGNYGVDQALLRMQREYQKNKTETVILGVVPDTISRIVSIWKHYYEYGNTFGFKPRFIIKDNQLQLIQNPIDETLKFHKFENYLDYIKENDFFYKNKFKKDILNFPYCITILKNIRRNFAIIYWILKIQSLKNSKKDFSELELNPMKIIMRINLEWRIKLFQDKQTTTLLKKIMEEFLILSQKNNFKAILIILPQKDDVNFIKNAIWIENTELDFYIGRQYGGMGSTLIKEKQTGELDKEHPIKVKAIDFNQWIMDNFSKDDYIVLKLDIEGAEYKVLDKMIDNKSIEYINRLFGEWHQNKIGMPKEDHAKLIDRLKKFGFDDMEAWRY